jgi:hypothetical protein
MGQKNGTSDVNHPGPSRVREVGIRPSSPHEMLCCRNARIELPHELNQTSNRYTDETRGKLRPERGGDSLLGETNTCSSICRADLRRIDA